jgi:sRNA-binding regulator protein Hfq
MNEDVEKNVSKFDWVAERSSCTLPKVFKTLRMQVEEDVKTRNAQRLKGSLYEFHLKEDVDKFTVLLESDVVHQSVIFKLAQHAILVLSGEGNPMFEVKLVFDDEGKCRLNVNDEQRDFWQVRRMALEDLLFRHY